MRTAIINEWLETYAGAELVIEQILRLYSGAEMFALVDFLPENQRGWLQGCKVHTSFLQRMPLSRRKFRAYLPFMPIAVEQHDLSDYDLVISSNHAVAKGVLTREDQLHVCYVHTPVRYAWDLYHSSLKEHGLSRGPKSWATRLILHYLRLWDHATASRVDKFAANSHYVARRIWKTYRRKATVIYPPVDVNRFTVQADKDDSYVTVSRLVPYKRVDLIIDAFRRMPDKQLIVIGDGPERAALERHAPPNVMLLGRQPAEVVTQHLQSARAFMFAADEDFGISPVEAQACGTPVIAFGHGGATETVVDGTTGILFPEQTPESIVAAVEQFGGCHTDFDPYAIREHAERFSVERFRRRFARFVARAQERRTSVPRIRTKTTNTDHRQLTLPR